MNYEKIKTCINTAIKKIKLKGSATAWIYIKNYCDNNMLNIKEREYIYKQIEKYLKKKSKETIKVDFTINVA